MKTFAAFTKKEFLEQLRTYKWLILFSVLFVFGMMSPLLAKLLPEIFKGMKVERMEIIIPEPTVIDAYSQYFKNLTQMGLLMINALPRVAKCNTITLTTKNVALLNRTQAVKGLLITVVVTCILIIA